MYVYKFIAMETSFYLICFVDNNIQPEIPNETLVFSWNIHQQTHTHTLVRSAACRLLVSPFQSKLLPILS